MSLQQDQCHRWGVRSTHIRRYYLLCILGKYEASHIGNQCPQNRSAFPGLPIHFRNITSANQSESSGQNGHKGNVRDMRPGCSYLRNSIQGYRKLKIDLTGDVYWFICIYTIADNLHFPLDFILSLLNLNNFQKCFALLFFLYNFM